MLFFHYFSIELEGSSSTGMEPRYFVVYPDGSGEELLQYEDVAQYISEAESNPSVAMLHGSVEGDDESTTITIIRPHEGSLNISIVQNTCIGYSALKNLKIFPFK